MGIFQRNKKAYDTCILYATVSGNSKKIATLTQKFYSRHGIKASCHSTKKLLPQKLKGYKNLLVVISTDGEGDPPPMAIRFFDGLFSKNMSRLQDLRYSVCALGDSSYEKFCETGKQIDERLAQLGATPILPRVDCDADYSDAAIKWIKQTLHSLNGNSSGMEQPDISIDTLPVPIETKITKKRLLSSQKSDNPCFHLELRSKEDLSDILPGDSIDIKPLNPSWMIKEILKEIKDAKTDDTFEKFLLSEAEITTLSKSTVLNYQKKANNRVLQGLINNPKDLKDFVLKANFLDLLTDFPVELTSLDVRGILPKLKGRLYSVASDNHFTQNELHLTVKAVRFNFRKRKHEGAGSIHLTEQLSVGTSIQIKHYPNLEFRLPEKTGTPLILIGVGTGVAPFRAFWQKYKRINVQQKIWLIWGDKYRDTDFIYKDEINQMSSENIIKNLDVVFSREGDNKIYVQDILQKRRAELQIWIKNGAHIYVCGSLAMAASIKETFLGLSEDDQLPDINWEKLFEEGRYHVDAY